MINKKLCSILIVMALSACNISFAQEKNAELESIEVQEQQELQETPSLEQENIKANKETLEKAQKLMAEKDYQSAIIYLSKYLSSKTKKYEAYKLRGECYYALRQYELAELDFQAAVDLKSGDDKLMTGTKYVGAIILGADKQEQLQNPELGNLYGALMYAQKALNNPVYEASYEKAVNYNTHIYLPKPKKDEITKINCPQKYGKKFNPEGVDAEIAAAIDNIEKGNFHEALYNTTAITENFPNYYLGYYLSGVAFSGMENFDDALISFQTALKLNPNDFESYASLGKLYYERAEKTFSDADAEKSTQYFMQALKYNPNCNTYYFYIGLNELLKKDYQKSVESFNLAIKLKNNDYNSIYYKLIAQYLLGDYKTVEEGTTGLLYRRVSNASSVQYLRALAKYKQGHLEDALDDIENIHNSLNDIYNADIKPMTEREKVLVSYLYYVKSVILKSMGMGIKSDLKAAMENPVIANIILKKSDFVMTSAQLDNQFDYLRETFVNYNLEFQYIEPNYKILLVTTPVQNIVKETPKAEPVEAEVEKPEQVVEATEPEKTEEKFEITEAPQAPEVSEAPKVPEEVEVSENVETVPVAEENITENEQKAEVEIQSEVSQETEKEAETVVETVAETKDVVAEKVQKENTLPAIVEKHADVDLKKFSLPKHLPEISEDDEVIVLEKPKNTFFDQAQEDITPEDVHQLNIPEIAKTIDEFPQAAEDVSQKVAQILDEETKMTESEPEIVVPAIIAKPDKKELEKIAEQQAKVSESIEPETPVDEVQVIVEEQVTDDVVEEQSPEVTPEEKPVKVKKQRVKKEKIKKEKVKKEKQKRSKKVKDVAE